MNEEIQRIAEMNEKEFKQWLVENKDGHALEVWIELWRQLGVPLEIDPEIKKFLPGFK